MAPLWRVRQKPAVSGILGRCGSAHSLWSYPAQQVLFCSCAMEADQWELFWLLGNSFGDFYTDTALVVMIDQGRRSRIKCISLV